ncbi:hypothetical protein Acsp06_50580 [Actinomycetospora sp. NBRC 106375]|uniref:PrsW family intramembrane metalloprotease n=1 Tax=Actinomycetospora sp. NBRC 106375 TaxID=3032207 RepID=UPI0024A00D1F|nr:PrsW family intramembrane metalloprotease [Actinomycetospora sp. NBRC 106375]GLZ48873.1 hypothetical protein Acsp06_50580 [Actinomycetospora sp. NBRC 106375]
MSATPDTSPGAGAGPDTTAESSYDELLAGRAAAIRVSGWGAPFRLFQPHNACFWVALALIALGLWNFVPSYVNTFGVFAAADITSLVTSGLFALVFLYFLHRSDRWERTPGRLVASAFVLGGFGAAFAVALPGNAPLMSIYTKLFGQAWAVDWKAGLTAPFVEESAKGICFLLLLGLAPVVIRTAYDGLIVGAYVGLGFQVLEDALYGQNSALEKFGADQVGNVASTFVLRALTGVASHALYTALFAAGLIYLIGTVAQPRRVGRGVALVLAAVVIHGVWDSSGAIADGTPLVSVVLVLTTVVAVVVLFWAIRVGGRRESEFMRAILAPEQARGTISDVELEAAAGHRRERRTFLRSAGDRATRRRRKHILHAIGDLAEDLSRSGGHDDEEVQHARSELHRIRG